MNQSEKTAVLCAISDSHLAHQIIQNIRQQFSKVPLEFDVVSDGRLAWSEFSGKDHPLVIIGADLPVLSGAELIREIRKVNGATCILFLCPLDLNPPEGVELVPIPIVDWDQFYGRFQSSLPDSIKSKYGLFERNSILVQKLMEYGQKYLHETEASTSMIKGPIALVPKVFQSSDGAIHSVSRSMNVSTRDIVFRRLSPEQQKVILKTELIVLGGLALLWGLTRFWKFEFGQELMSDLSHPLFYVLLVSFAGFFIGRVFDRFIFPKNEVE